jgi:hypothetical protein
MKNSDAESKVPSAYMMYLILPVSQTTAEDEELPHHA